MEDLPGDLEKEITGRSLPKASKRRPKWTLLFVGDDGRTRSVRPFKGLFYLFVGILMISLAANAVLYVFHRDGLKEKRRLAGEVNRLRQQVDTLRYDKDVLMARMVMTRTKVKEAPTAPKSPKAPVKSPEEPKSVPARGRTEEVKPIQKAAAPETSVSPSPTAAEAPPPEAPASRVSVAELRVFRSEANANTVIVRFNLRKTDGANENVSGHAFAVLRLPEDDSRVRTRYVTMPWASLDTGTPKPTSQGQYFSISRFKPMKFERRNIKGLEQFSRLTVYVFDTAGGVLLEKEFSIQIPAVETVLAPEAAPVQTSSPDTTETPASETVQPSTPETVESETPETIEPATPENVETPENT